ncbi:conserved hypothetical protein (plasmid) [Gloeothece citriformis PCC 7424]|uniref:Uncharacterized protein n=1 Tax=Gloeothece citriformis (strain PCC 7424) TaxID=65393 RepID=B7KLS9_GLOC7|nr:hypothetical protein [Gloeothece citriformis]ACK73751.1 conserved hypothetical protein [Gloeothece citriformis PCC 7424]
MKIQTGLALFLILFLAVGCNSGKQETESQNATPTVESNNAKSDANTLSTEANVKTGAFVSGEHPTEGSVRLLTEQGQKFIELDSICDNLRL